MNRIANGASKQAVKQLKQNDSVFPPELSQGLSIREQLFVVAYVLETHGNGKAAARLAGYKGSDEYLTGQAVTLLGRVHIRKAVEVLFSASHMGKAELLARLADIARGLSGLVSWRVDDKTGREIAKLNIPKLIDEGREHIIKKISFDRNNNQVIEFYSATDALNTIGKHLGLWRDSLEVNVGMSDEQVNALETLREKLNAMAQRTGQDAKDTLENEPYVIDGEVLERTPVSNTDTDEQPDSNDLPEGAGWLQDTAAQTIVTTRRRGRPRKVSP